MGRNFKCVVGLHNWQTITDNIGIYDRSNPYASMGQMQDCALRLCLRCNKAMVSPLVNDKPNEQWFKVVNYINKEQKVLQFQSEFCSSSTIIKKDTPIVETLIR